MTAYTACTVVNEAKVPPITGGTRQDVEHAIFRTWVYDNDSSGDTRSQCATVRLGPDGLQN
jgi:hypothetical protein